MTWRYVSLSGGVWVCGRYRLSARIVGPLWGVMMAPLAWAVRWFEGLFFYSFKCGSVDCEDDPASSFVGVLLFRGRGV